MRLFGPSQRFFTTFHSFRKRTLLSQPFNRAPPAGDPHPLARRPLRAVLKPAVHHLGGLADESRRRTRGGRGWSGQLEADHHVCRPVHCQQFCVVLNEPESCAPLGRTFWVKMHRRKGEESIFTASTAARRVSGLVESPCRSQNARCGLYSSAPSGAGPSIHSRRFQVDEDLSSTTKTEERARGCLAAFRHASDSLMKQHGPKERETERQSGPTSRFPPRRGLATATSPPGAVLAMQAAKTASKVRLEPLDSTCGRPLMPQLSRSCASSHDPVTAARRRCEPLRRRTQLSRSTQTTSRPPNSHCYSSTPSASSTLPLERLRRGGNGGGNGSRRTLAGMDEGSWRTRHMHGRRDTLTGSSSSIARCSSGRACGKRWLKEVRLAIPAARSAL